jgi:hypothetical protein
MNDTQRTELLDNCLAKLSEHFDHVQILATWDDSESTMTLERGAGNWYARQGMAQAFINRDQAQDHASQLAKAIKPQEGDE